METIIIKDLIKHRDRKPTIRQVRAVSTYIMANGGKSKAEVLREVGYGEGMVRTPSKVFGSPVVRKLLLGQ